MPAARGNDVKRLGCVAREHDVVPVGRADELGDAMTRHLDRLGGLDREAVQATKRVRVHLLVEAALRVKHGSGALRGGGTVQKHQVGMVGKQREVALVGVLRDVGGANDVARRGRGCGSVRGVGNRARSGVACGLFGGACDKGIGLAHVTSPLRLCPRARRARSVLRQGAQPRRAPGRPAR